MKSKQRLLAAIRGEAVDRIPWSPFLAYYWEHLPLETQQIGQFEYFRQMGADPLLRGFHTLYKRIYKDCEIEDKVIGRESFRTFRTPVGTLTERSVRSDNGNTWFLVDHPVKTAEDFKILQYIHEHLVIEPDMERFNADLEFYGDDDLQRLYEALNALKF